MMTFIVEGQYASEELKILIEANTLEVIKKKVVGVEDDLVVGNILNAHILQRMGHVQKISSPWTSWLDNQYLKICGSWKVFWQGISRIFKIEIQQPTTTIYKSQFVKNLDFTICGKSKFMDNCLVLSMIFLVIPFCPLSFLFLKILIS